MGTATTLSYHTGLDGNPEVPPLKRASYKSAESAVALSRLHKGLLIYRIPADAGAVNTK